MSDVKLPRPTSVKRRISFPASGVLTASMVALAVGVALLLLSGLNIVDDAFISMRYAANLAHGNGLVFNVGERVEGFSNPLTTLLLSGASAIGLPLPQVAIALGVGAYLTTIPLSVFAAARLGARPLAAGLAGLLVAASPQLVGTSTNGLETTLFGLSLLASAFTLSEPATRPVWLTCSLLMLAGTRPEGPVLVIVMVAIALAARRRAGLGNRTVWRAGSGVLGATLIGLMIRFLYYGELIPTSVTAKRDLDVDPITSFLRHVGDGLSYIRQSLGDRWLVLLAATLLLALLRWRPKGPILVFLAVGATAIAFGILISLANGGDWMPFARLLAPYLPIVFVTLCVAMSTMTSKAWVIAAWATLLIALAPWSAFQATNRGIDEAYNRFGIQLAASLHSNDEVVTNVLGRLGYSGRSLRLFDAHGLTEPTIAKLPIAGSWYGKFGGTAVAAERHAVAIVMNNPTFLEAVVAAGDTEYVGAIGRQLTRATIYLAVRADAASRFASILRKQDARLVPLEEAVTNWNRTYPSDEGGP